MRSSVSWTIGLVHLTSLLTIPVAAHQAIAQEYPSCFMITSSGRMLDLTELCQSLPLTPPAHSSASMDRGGGAGTLPPTPPAHSDTQRARTIRISPATPAHHYTQPTVGVRGSDDHWLSGLNTVRRYAPDQWSGYVLNRGPHGFEEPSRGDRQNGSSDGGNCDYPWQLDARGRRCGERAASERPGGRLGGQ